MLASLTTLTVLCFVALRANDVSQVHLTGALSIESSVFLDVATTASFDAEVP